jgi:hypothetical protein
MVGSADLRRIFQLQMVVSADLRRDTTLLTEIYQVRAAVSIQKLQKTGKITNYCKKLKVMNAVT